ncbi:MAG TPA: nucleotide pyrophosphohydrolase [Candidatus Saccharimonadales bacterium]|nr:nucleotide pyrophosphohydrolase [Candidatus Saccharimonadales bacterium]
MSDSIQKLTEEIISYRDERDWKQFHTPKNMAANISVEAGELLEHFRWSEHPDNPVAMREEAADVLYALLLFAHDAGFDIAAELRSKLDKNAAKYPVEKVKGKHHKYDHYEK